MPMLTDERLSICVFCGALPGFSPLHLKASTELGQLIGERRHRLIYGAGAVGLMGALAEAVLHAGGQVTGVVPHFLRERELSTQPPGYTFVTRDMAERKRRMLHGADAYIALPGGYGTLDEITEVMSLTVLGLQHKPLVLVNIEEMWSPFVRLVEQMVKCGFVHAGDGDLFHVVSSPREAVDVIAELRGAPGSWAAIDGPVPLLTDSEEV